MRYVPLALPVALAILLFGCAGSGTESGGAGLASSSGGGTTATTGSTGTTGTVKSVTDVSPMGLPEQFNASGYLVGIDSGQSYTYGAVRSPVGVLTLLKGIDPARDSGAGGINNAGVVVGGSSDSAGNIVPTIWHGATPSKLAILNDGKTASYGANAINDNGQIVGDRVYTVPGQDAVQQVSLTGSPTGGFFTLTVTIEGAKETTDDISFNATAANIQNDLNALSPFSNQGDFICSGGPLPTSPVTVHFSNFVGQMPEPLMTAVSSLSGGTSPGVKVTQITAGTSSSSQTQGLYWSSMNAAPVGLMPIGFFPTAINKSGEVVGYVQTGQNDIGHPITIDYYEVNVSAPNSPVHLGTLTAVTSTDYSVAINNAGTVVFNAGSVSGTAYMRLANGQQSTIAANAEPISINSQGDVVGTLLHNGAFTHAFIYTKAGGVKDLNMFLPANSGWTLKVARAISDTGLVAGFGGHPVAGASFLIQLPAGAF